MLQTTEAQSSNIDIDRVNELIKVSRRPFSFLSFTANSAKTNHFCINILYTHSQGNMQRSKIVADSIQEARTQILKVFDHKMPVSDIIHRCASKRNFKKREKV